MAGSECSKTTLSSVEEKIIQDSLWFALASSSQTYKRTKGSKSSSHKHVARIFRGKIGELFFICEMKKVLSHIFSDKNYEESLNIYWGQGNVDKMDSSLLGKISIDVKTVICGRHKFMLVPVDQVKEGRVYVCVGLYSEELQKDEDYVEFVKEASITSDGLKLPLRSISLQAGLLGFAWSRDLKEVNNKICPETKCRGIEIDKLKEMGDLKKLIET